MAIFSVKHLNFCYPQASFPALNDVNLEIERGEFVLLCGPSGCGKSTLLRLLKPQLAPNGEQAGELFYDGAPLSLLSPARAACEIGFVFQNPDAQIVCDTVARELAFGLENLGLSGEEIRQRIAEVCEFFGISAWYHKKTDTLSGGQKQLLNLASVLAMHPKVLLLDEPTAQLDPIAASEFISALRKLNEELGLTILLAEHRLEELFPCVDRVAVMDRARVFAATAPREVSAQLRKENHPMTAALPCAVRLYEQLGYGGECPLTVREGKAYLLSHCTNRFDRFEVTQGAEREVALALRGGYFRYEKDAPDVVSDLDLTVYRGETLCILGGNGSGKSTLLHLLCGARKLLRGRLRILQEGRISCLTQNPLSLFVYDTVRKDLQEAARYGKSEGEIENLAREMGIESLLDAHPFDLSGGELQKAATAKVLLLRPQILLLDEPTKGLDALSKRAFAALLARLKAKGVTVVIVTHDTEFASEYADRCASLFDGKIVSVCDPYTFFSQNHFYTTAAARISRPFYQNAVTCKSIAALAKKNEEAQDEL